MNEEQNEMVDKLIWEISKLRTDISNEIRKEITGYGKKRDKVDWAKWLGLVLGTIGMISAFSMFVFKTNAAANLEHAQITANHERDALLHDYSLQGQKEAQQQMLKKLDAMNENQIKIGEQLRVKGLKGNGK